MNFHNDSKSFYSLIFLPFCPFSYHKMSKVSTYSVKLINTNYNTIDVPKQKVRTVGQLFPYCLKRLKVPYFSIAGFPTVSIEYNKNNYSFDFSLAKLNYKSGDTIYMYFPKSMNIFFKIKSPQCQNEKIKKTHFETDYVRDAKLSLSMDLKVPFHFIKLYYIDEQELKDEIKLTNLIRKKENPMELYLLYEINCLECTFQNKTLNQRLKIYPLFIEPGTTISEIKAIISHKNNLSESEIILKNKDEELNNDFLVIKNMKLSIEKGRKEPKSNIPVIKLESINKNIFTILQSLKFPNNHSLNRLKQTIIDEYSKFGIIIPYSMIIFNLIEVEPKKKSKSQGSKTKNKKSETERQIETYIVQCKKFIIQFIFGNEKLQLEVTYFDKIIDAKNELSKKLNQEISCLSIFYDNSPIDDNENIYKYKDLNLTLNCTKSINVKINFLKPDGAIFSVDIDRHHSFAEIYDDFIYSYDYFELLFEDEIIHRDTPVSKFANNRTPIVIQLCNPICTFILNSKEKVTYELDETKKIKEIISDLMKMYPNQVNSHSKIYYQDTPITKTSELKSYQKTFLIKSEIKCQETISHIRTNQQKKSLHYHEPSTNEQSTPNKLYRPQLVQIEPKKRKLSKDTSKNPAVDATIDSSPNSFREVTFIIFKFTFGQKRCDLDYNVQYTSFLQYLQDIKFPKPKLFVFTLNRKEIEITQLFNHKNVHNSIHVHIAPKGKQDNKYGFRFKEIFRNYKFDLQVSVNDIIRSVWEDFRLFNYSLNSLVLSFWDIIIDGKEILGNLSLPQGSKFELLDKSSIKLIICKSSQNFEINASEKDSVSDLKVNLEKLFKEYKGLLYLNGVTVNGSDLVSKYNQQILTIDQPDLSFKRDLNDDKRDLLDNSNKMLELLFNVDGEKFRFRANQETTVGEAINEIQSYVLEGKAEVKICDCDMEVLDDEIFLKDAKIPLNLIRTILISFEYEKTNRTINHKVWSSDNLKSIRPKW
ncbi:hypothetical protein TRFO_24629 [Tritrichomonas foetus]|uniref:Ubiquitin-like domain-containing protein n=1 Tax=Tritrichomonas foetus TaxID=1144522 RepID=A0A1J4KCA9_9EUKA|nr:hypothetical protein TRFO_24629 [Tritrichomonas foetus]|eukprot:OHT07286.1 hypothetical protein TRFO_24629 [Tritrichomonas foetus]